MLLKNPTLDPVKTSDSIGLWGSAEFALLGGQRVHAHQFYEFDLETHIPPDPLLRGIDRLLDLNDLLEGMRGFHRPAGRPSIDPALTIRMLVLGSVMGPQSGRRPCPL